jgi:hypothetical protein
LGKEYVTRVCNGREGIIRLTNYVHEIVDSKKGAVSFGCLFVGPTSTKIHREKVLGKPTKQPFLKSI